MSSTPKEPCANLVLDNLYIGPMPSDIGPYQFAISVGERPPYRVPIGKTVIVAPLMDSHMLSSERHLHMLAEMANTFSELGPTLVHCTLGFNRSALIVGLALIKRGMAGEDAIALLRTFHHPDVLQNKAFYQWLNSFK